MSDSAAKKKKKIKKSKKEVKPSNNSDSSDEELDLTKECHPIAHYIHDRPQMVAEMFSVIKGSKLKAMLPPVIKDYDVEKLKLKCLDQLLGMSEKRILRILDGEILESSSESEVPTDDSEESPSDESSSDSSTHTKSSHSHKKKKATVKPDPDAPQQPVRTHNLWNPEDPTPPENQGKTLLEILELEMRARAIRALLKNDTSKESQPVIEAHIDLTEDDHPPIKKEVPSEQDEDFTDRIQKSSVKNKEKSKEEAKKKQLMVEQELRNKLIKKKTYRTREQRLENLEPELPPVREKTPIEKGEDEVIPVDVVKVEPTEIVIDDPEEGEVSSEEEETVIIKEEAAEAEAVEGTVAGMESSPKVLIGERISAISEGEFEANTDVLLQVNPNENDVTEMDESIIVLENLGSQSNEGNADSGKTTQIILQDEIQVIEGEDRDISRGRLAQELKEIEEQIDRRTQLPIIIDNSNPEVSSLDSSSKILVFKIGEKGKEMHQYAVAADAPPVYELSDSDGLEDDDIMIIEEEEGVEIEVGDLKVLDKADNSDCLTGDTWRARWLSRDKVQKVVKSSKICAMVRKRMKQKKVALKTQQSLEDSTPPPECDEATAPDVAPVIEGRVSEYELISGKKVIETEEIVRNFLNEILDRVVHEKCDISKPDNGEGTENEIQTPG